MAGVPHPHRDRNNLEDVQHHHQFNQHQINQQSVEQTFPRGKIRRNIHHHIPQHRYKCVHKYNSCICKTFIFLFSVPGVKVGGHINTKRKHVQLPLILIIIIIIILPIISHILLPLTKKIDEKENILSKTRNVIIGKLKKMK